MWFRKKEKKMSYDPSLKKPVIRVSICTGERTAGFQQLPHGKFEEVMLIRNQRDLDEFRERYGISGEIERIY